MLTLQVPNFKNAGNQIKMKPVPVWKGTRMSNHLANIKFECCFNRWRFVVHGGVDGYSRLIVFLGLSDNNRAATVLQLFKAAVTQWGLPQRVR